MASEASVRWRVSPYWGNHSPIWCLCISKITVLNWAIILSFYNIYWDVRYPILLQMCSIASSESLYQALSQVQSCNWIYPDKCMHLQWTPLVSTGLLIGKQDWTYGFNGRSRGWEKGILWCSQKWKIRTLEFRWWKRTFTITLLPTYTEELALAWAAWLIHREQNYQRLCKGHHICDSCKSKVCFIFLVLFFELSGETRLIKW